jgi:very-short-patch-repair endonuclease
MLVKKGGMDMGGGMGGAPGGAPGGSPMGAAASSQKIYRRGKGPKEEMEPQVQKPVVMQLTKPESRMLRTLQAMRLPFNLFAQYKQPVANESNFYLMDFALPEIAVAIEVDGEKWHSSEEDKAKDKQRDMTLASMGWRVLRFTEMAIAEQMGKVQEVILKEVSDASKEKKHRSKKASSENILNYKSGSFSPFDGCEIYKQRKHNNE